MKFRFPTKARGYVAYVFYFLKDTFVYANIFYLSVPQKSRIRTQTMSAETAKWFLATFTGIINLLYDSVVQNGQLNSIS